MKLKIKVRRINKRLPLPQVIAKGDWIDLRASETVHLIPPQAGTLKTVTVDGKKVSRRDVTFDSALIKLGVAMELPKGCEAIVASRSGTFKNFQVMLTNGKGVIDYTYKGDHDEWKYNAIAFGETTITEGDRICQFRIQLSQKATFWQKLRWFFSSGIELVEVNHLGDVDRGGHGTTGTR